MLTESYKHRISNYSDHELYLETWKKLVREYSGFKYNSEKNDILWDECYRRRKSDESESKIFLAAYEDALATIESIETSSKNKTSGITEIQRTEFMSVSELANSLRFVNKNLNLNNQILPDFETMKNNLTICKVQGDSMINIGIKDGDTIFVDKYEVPEDNKIIVAVINQEMFVKRLRLINNQTWLCSENNKYIPVLITPDMDFKIFGVVKHLLQKV